MHDQGYLVTGSDSGSNAQTEHLTSTGVEIQRGHEETANAASADLVVITAAVKDNPEIVAARDAGIPIIKRAQLLGILARQKTSIAVAGSHGKSTTSGMVVTALDVLDADPSYFVGAVVASSGSNSAWTDGEHIVVEADEYDRSFWTLHPDVAIITNIEFDHPDLFTPESYDEAFARFASQIVDGGTLVARGDDPGVARILPGLTIAPIKVVTFGEDVTSDWRITQRAGGWEVTPPGGTPIAIDLRVPGRHNVMNATAALIVLTTLGFEPQLAASALAAFSGVGRRFELAGEAAGVTVIDDYAHHPTEIAATLQAARDRFPGRRIWAIFQPHTFSRTEALIDDFATALAVADEIVLLDIYAAREIDDGRVSSADMQRLIGPRARVVPGVPDVVPAVYPLLQEGDVVLTIGAGDVTHAAPALVHALERGSID
ncbi:MAG: UDP-N-acetylmuramate--L-alanine ligase [Thermomicrobiales bacterium]|nr:UDP-N-acetylmuramate--L-alanine ligase [Thermomicrobiales bacterium]